MLPDYLAGVYVKELGCVDRNRERGTIASLQPSMRVDPRNSVVAGRQPVGKGLSSGRTRPE